VAIPSIVSAEILDIPLVSQIGSARAESEPEIALVLGGLVIGFGVAFFASIGKAKDAAGKNVRCCGGMTIALPQVRGHLKGCRGALIVDGALLYVSVGNGVGLNGVEFEGGGGGVKILSGDVELRQNAGEILGARGHGGQQREGKHGKQDCCRSQTHIFPS